MDPRVAVVTGGTGGIGRAVVARLSADRWRAVGVGRGECDVTDEAAVEAFFAGLERVDALVVAAGVSSSAPLVRTSLEQWEEQLRVNATGAFLCLRAVMPGMRARGWGRVVVVASVAGLVGAPYVSAYCASKHAAVGLVRSVAAEVAGTGVTVNAVCPDYVDSPMTDRTVDRIVAATGRSPAEARLALEAMSAHGRLLTPEEVAGTVAYLCSDAAGTVNGQALDVVGGGGAR
jgi:NAD(P)-dependent dehydrogenase (short-subunit alcohol dehydrogenase family)